MLRRILATRFRLPRLSNLFDGDFFFLVETRMTLFVLFSSICFYYEVIGVWLLSKVTELVSDYSSLLACMRMPLVWILKSRRTAFMIFDDPFVVFFTILNFFLKFTEVLVVLWAGDFD